MVADVNLDDGTCTVPLVRILHQLQTDSSAKLPESSYTHEYGSGVSVNRYMRLVSTSFINHRVVALFKILTSESRQRGTFHTSVQSRCAC